MLGRMLVMLDKQVSWLFLCWNMILLGSFYDTMTNKQHEIVFLDTNNNFKHFILNINTFSIYRLENNEKK
jgi:hypothetical protein